MASLVARHVIPVYIWSPEEEGQFQPGKQSRWWLHHSLKSLQGDLAKLGASLVMRQGTESFPVLEELIKVRAPPHVSPPNLNPPRPTNASRLAFSLGSCSVY